MLQSDGWHQPCYNASANADAHRELQLVKGVLEEDTPNTEDPVWRTFVSWVQAKARNRENIVLSSENLDRESIHISLLANVLAPFRTTVVVAYRPFFEWVPSIHRQIAHQGNVVTLSRWLTPYLATGIDTWKFP